MGFNSAFKGLKKAAVIAACGTLCSYNVAEAANLLPS
jgi:NADPH-dependent curcumin reductase CurA